MSDATCKTCPWCWAPLRTRNKTKLRECRRNAPQVASAEETPAWWPAIYEDDWCREHPDRQPHLEGVSTTLVTRETAPTAADMRRIVDALEKMASRAARVKA